MSFGGPVRDSVVEWNRLIGISAQANSVIANNVVSANGFNGISLSAGGPHGGLVIANSVAGNIWESSPWSGIFITSGASALLNNVSENTGAGISAGDLITPPYTAGVELNTINGNGGEEIVGGVIIGCNTTDSTKICP